MTVKDVVDLLRRLQMIHDAGTVHRDIKPENILRVGGVWKFSDFGLSKSISSYSRSGSVKGTPEYMAPEQCMPRRMGPADERTDIWQMGIIAYKVVAGAPPYRSADAEELILAICNEGPDIDAVPERYRGVLAKALAHERGDRYRTAAEFADALEKAMGDEPEPVPVPAPAPEPEPAPAPAKDVPLGAAGLLALAESGDADAQYRLGRMYDLGDGVPRDFSTAAHWYGKAAEQGHPLAQNNLGILYAEGSGVRQSDSDAASWISLSADQGCAMGQYNMGVLHEDGRGVSQSYSKAAEYYRKAAEQGLASAQNNLGVLYEDGRGVAKSYDEAVSWYRKAATQGHAPGQFSLGHMYESGRGVGRSREQAMSWYRKAADQGHPEAARKVRR
ncbi:MAG: Sel1-like repeat-containing protein kinase family protein [Thermoplasmata archaeon]|nr:Sel1-like repeat-containing protein kinase family protein [Thermoplasmata archaeon]